MIVDTGAQPGSAVAGGKGEGVAEWTRVSVAGTVGGGDSVAGATEQADTPATRSQHNRREFKTYPFLSSKGDHNPAGEGIPTVRVIIPSPTFQYTKEAKG
jgi:hypothetical protein